MKNDHEYGINYDSPLMLQYTETVGKLVDDTIMESFVKLGITIDKDKLVQCLQQDKSRYEEAYHRGYAARENDLIRCRNCKFISPLIKRCANINSPCWMMRVEDDFYCGKAERKDETDG